MKHFDLLRSIISSDDNEENASTNGSVSTASTDDGQGGHPTAKAYREAQCTTYPVNKALSKPVKRQALQKPSTFKEEETSSGKFVKQPFSR